MSANPFRELQSVARLLDLPALVDARSHYSHDATAEAARAELETLREKLASHEPIDLDGLANRIVARLDRDSAPRLRSVINATGVVLHTNLGRAPLHEDAARAAYDAARGYLNLELDLGTGKRTSRQGSVRAGLKAITGAESATAVNNCAAATVIALRSVAAHKEV